jgi:hypothetical protein
MLCTRTSRAIKRSTQRAQTRRVSPLIHRSKFFRIFVTRICIEQMHERRGARRRFSRFIWKSMASFDERIDAADAHADVARCDNSTHAKNG